MRFNKAECYAIDTAYQLIYKALSTNGQANHSDRVDSLIKEIRKDRADRSQRAAIARFIDCMVSHEQFDLAAAWDHIAPATMAAAFGAKFKDLLFADPCNVAIYNAAVEAERTASKRAIKKMFNA